MLKYLSVPKAALFGEDIIDSGHQAMVDALNKIVDILNTDSKANLRDLMTSLEAVMLAHFAEEEAIMESIQYPGSKRHKEQHQLIHAGFRRMIDGCTKERCACFGHAYDLFDLIVTDILHADIPLKTYMEEFNYLNKPGSKIVVYF